MNRLAQETSPYLRQHAENPVDWFPWGNEALDLARKLDRPILLSIGYSSCHWCHVMARECFEDFEIAALMNAHFVNIKVDREERPDLDHIYQLAHAMLTGRSGGWPLTLFLSSEKTPFFGGTYFPKEAAYGLPGFKEILPRIADAYRQNRGEIEAYSARLEEALEESVQKLAPSDKALDGGPVDAALASLEKRLDPVSGGFGLAPKFPNPTLLDLCLSHPRYAQLALFTLEKMAEGGIRDQLGGGFFRYSVDDTWTIPHFEKMLYDNACLLRLYADAWVITKKPVFRDAAYGIANWTMREMQSADGGYYSSMDADSEHVEGKFYCWTREEIASILDKDEFAAASLLYGLDAQPNFEHSYHFHLASDLDAISHKLGKDAQPVLDSAKAKLFDARARRVSPERDEKILASWNALMIGAMAHAHRVFGEAAWLYSARQALVFLRTALWKTDRLLATCKDGQAKLNAYLDDYAYLLDAMLEFLQAEFSVEALDFSISVAEALLSRFEDNAEGGFYFTSHDHEALLIRQKPAEDAAIPSGNGVAAFALQRLGHLLGEPRYLESARKTLLLFREAAASHPTAHAAMLKALVEAISPPSILILQGKENKTWQEAVSERYLPHVTALAIEEGTADLPQALDKGRAEKTSAWLCTGTTCLPPIFVLSELLSALSS